MIKNDPKYTSLLFVLSGLVLYEMSSQAKSKVYSISTDTVITYKAQGKINLSSQYKVVVAQGTKNYEPDVYVSQAQFTKYNKSKNTSYATFSSSGKITVNVNKLNGDFKSCKILPSSYGIVTKTNGNSITFELDSPRNIAVEFDNDMTYPLLIFANPLEKEIFKPGDKNVLYYAPGFYDNQDTIFLKANQTLYLAGGAVLSAYVMGNNAPNSRIMGRGIISGSRFPHSEGRFISFDHKSDDVYLEGITIVDAPGYYITTDGKNTHAKNIKALGWWFNTDGFCFGTNGLIEDCFLKCNDDAIKLYHSGNKVFRTTIWQMENGAPFQISWNTRKDETGFIVKDCDVIHCDHQWNNPNEAVFDAIHGGSGNLSNFLFENIRIENTDWKLISIQIMKNEYAHSKILGTISNITFKNINVTSTNGNALQKLSIIKGFDQISSINNVLFDNVRINGQNMTSEKEWLNVDHSSVFNVQFK